MNLRTAALVACSFALLFTAARSFGEDAKKQPGIAEAEMAMRGFKAPPGVTLELFAAEPMVVNPVAFTIDNRGRFFVAESYRQSKGIEDNRGHAEWLLHDLAARTVEDRLAYIKKFAGDKIGRYTQFEDRITLVEDTDGDGKADSSKVFAGGFNDILDGTGASVITRGNDVYYTCIPHVWLLRDPKGAGVASERVKLSSGYGVHFALRGHDMHGLRFGPDGKLYWSIGDRGFHVKTKEGRTLDNVDTGAVLRCDPDGANLEIFATGLRNPQQLVFDKYGNLFTGDNNSDAGDKARWVYVVEGGDTGWRMAYQYRPDRGPFNRENPWHVNEPGHPAWNIPPIDYITNGPSGVAVNPGVSTLPEKYRDAFFLCDFKGAPGNSLVHAIWNVPDGAGFKMKHEPFIEQILCTDVAFSPDGNLYISDWVNGWDGIGKGRLYRAGNPSLAAGAPVLETKKLLAEGMAKRSEAELTRLLEHADMRVRQGAQFALADRGPSSVAALVRVGTDPKKTQLARIHALWGLGQIGRKAPAALASVPAMLADKDDEVRAQAAKVLGDGHAAQFGGNLIPLLKDPNARVRYFAAVSLGKLGAKNAIEPVAAMLRENADKDVFLRHGGMMALAGIDDATLLTKANDASASVRLGVLLALRHRQSAAVAKFLNDADPFLALEAARAIYDVPINAAMPALAAAIARKDAKDRAWFDRVIFANHRLGKMENAKALAAFAADTARPEDSRADALDALRDWFIGKQGTPADPQPTDLDRLHNLWRPLPARPATDALAAAAPILPALLKSSPKLQQAAAQLAAKLKIAQAGDALLALATDPKADAGSRIEALRALMEIPGAKIADAVRIAMTDKDARIRKEGVDALAKRDPAAAVKVLATVLDTGTTIEKQGALAALGTLKNKEANAMLLSLLDQQAAGKIPAEIQLDLLEAARTRDSAEIKARLAKLQPAAPGGDLVAQFSDTLTGGDAAKGKKVFFENEAVSCVRCHKIGGVGGEAGPDLSHVAARGDRRYLLESIIAPNAKIAAGYERITVSLTDQFYTGRVLAEDATTIKLEITNDDGTMKPVTVLKSQVTERKGEPSAMLEGFKDILKPAELRDLVEFLATQK